MKKMTLQMILGLNKAVQARDPYTGEHSEDVKEISRWIVEELGIEWTEDLDYASQLHDIGKIGIPDKILNLKTKLTKKERALMEEHPEIGRDILEAMDFLKGVAHITYCHQEKYDGSGYPEGRKGEEIPLEARIVAVADAYHAMVSDRPYRPALSLKDAARQLLEGRGKQFDPNVVDALIRRLLKMYSASGKLTGNYIKNIDKK
jgi:HD-GYP domain-containing protein (c-di-GMP phosphodiesterase class II)